MQIRDWPDDSEKKNVALEAKRRDATLINVALRLEYVGMAPRQRERSGYDPEILLLQFVTGVSFNMSTVGVVILWWERIVDFFFVNLQLTLHNVHPL